MLVRSALLWLLLFALPLQGFAAATMLTCGPNHHRVAEFTRSAAAESQGHATHGDPHHDHDHAMGAADAGAVTAADGGAAGAGAGASSAHHLDKLSKFKCSACASCCIGAALPAAALLFASFAPAAAPSFFVAVEPVGFFTDGPDRPPRILLD